MHDDEAKLKDVHPDETFKASTGTEIKNLKELIHLLDGISPHSFEHHVNDEKNDFAAWIRHSVSDNELAELLESTTDFDKTKQIVSDRIQLLEKRIEVKKIKESLEDLRSDSMGIDKVPDDLADPSDLPDFDEKPGISEPVSEPIEPGLSHAINSSDHPFEHVKKSMHLMMRDVLIGVLIGLIIGWIIGKFF